jgi:hypothetical protein
MTPQNMSSAQPPTSAERRWQRHKLDLPVRLILRRDGNTTSIVSARGSEISEGGMLVFAGTELKTGDEIAVEFTPPFSSEPVRVRGTIRNRAGYKYGMEFIATTSEEKDITERFRTMLRLATSGV